LVTSDFYQVEISSGYTSLAGVTFSLTTDPEAARLGPTANLRDFGANTADTNDTGAVVSSGQWHYVAGTFDGVGLQLYIDGKAWGAKTLHPGRIIPMLPGSFLSFGSEDGRRICSVCEGKRYFNGLLDEVRIFNQALSAEEIAATFRAVQESAPLESSVAEVR
jgi:hypothetical protein